MGRTPGAGGRKTPRAAGEAKPAGRRGAGASNGGLFRKILVPVDLTPKNAAAVEMARRLCRAGGSEIILLHVIETLDLPFEELEDFYLKLEEEAGRAIGELGAPLEAAGIPVREHITYGKRASEIVGYAEEVAADLILLSSHRIDPQAPERWATISYQVAVLASCPVLLVK